MAPSIIDKLPLDVLSKILLLFPAKDLCRLRTVCRSWRSTISDASFIRDHTERHKEQPLFLSKFQDDDSHVYIADLSGIVVKRIAGADGGHQVQRSAHLTNLACLSTVYNTCRLLNAATGRIQVLPLVPAVHHVNGVLWKNPCTFFALGRLVSSTGGQHKLLRYCRPFIEISREVQVLTINGGTNYWRPRPGPRYFIDMRSGVVVDGVVCFLNHPAPASYYDTTVGDGTNVPAADIISSFDLATEEWRRDLHGPLSSTGDIMPAEFLWGQMSLADLKHSLVLARCHSHQSILDLWFLQDYESELWVKEYSIRIGSVTSSMANVHQIIPLLVLNDGRLVIYLAPVGIMFICDPRTNTFTRVHMRGRLDSVGVYTGSLLSLQ